MSDAGCQSIPANQSDFNFCFVVSTLGNIGKQATNHFTLKTVPHEQLWQAMRCWGEPPDRLEGVEADRMACALEPGD